MTGTLQAVVVVSITSIMRDRRGDQVINPLKFNGRREGEGTHMYLKQLRLVFLLPLAKASNSIPISELNISTETEIRARSKMEGIPNPELNMELNMAPLLNLHMPLSFKLLGGCFGLSLLPASISAIDETQLCYYFCLSFCFFFVFDG